MRDQLKDYIRFYGYTGQHELGDDGSPETEFFDFDGDLKEDDKRTELSEINGFKRLNENTLSQIGSKPDPIPSYKICVDELHQNMRETNKVYFITDQLNYK